MTDPINQQQLTNFRIDKLEKDFNSLDEKIDKILQNHLPHIQAEVSSVRVEMRVLSALNVSAIIVGIIITNFLLR